MILFGHLLNRWPPFKYRTAYGLLPRRFKHHQRQKSLQESSEPKPECLEPCKLPRRSWWSMFRSNRKQPKCLEKDPPKPPPLCETVEIVSEEQAEADLHQIEKMGGKAFRTCGTAYVLQKDHVKPTEIPHTSEDHILEDMNKDPSIKGTCDPMPPFQSVELRLIELSERKLHPLYKKLMSIPKPPSSGKTQTHQGPQYKTRSGPVMAEDFPKHLKINKECLDRKNILYECKKAEPPPQMVNRMIEMKMNERPKLKNDKDKDCSGR